MMVEDDGSGGSMQKLSEDVGRWRFATIAFSAGGRRSCVSVEDVEDAEANQEPVEASGSHGSRQEAGGRQGRGQKGCGRVGRGAEGLVFEGLVTWTGKKPRPNWTFNRKRPQIPRTG